MFASAKSLFISDQDKRKHFCLLLRLFLGNRQEVGSFPSRMIKVISKPSQKRQSMKNADCEARFSMSSTCFPLYEPQKHFIIKIFTSVELHLFESLAAGGCLNTSCCFSFRKQNVLSTPFFLFWVTIATWCDLLPCNW